MRYGFTMIELIFVIAIIGILAAVSIPKIAATRDDAVVSALATNIGLCIREAAAEYQSKGKLDDLNLTSCSKANDVESDVVTLSGNNVVVNSSNAAVQDILANGNYPVKGDQVDRNVSLLVN